MPKRVAANERALLALVARLIRANQKKGVGFCWGTLGFFAGELGLRGHARRDENSVDYSFVTELLDRLQMRGLLWRGKPYEDPQIEEQLERLAAEGKIPRRPRKGLWPDVFQILDGRVLDDPRKLDEVLGYTGNATDSVGRPRAQVRKRRRRRGANRPCADQPSLPFDVAASVPPRDCVGQPPRDCVGQPPRDCVGQPPRDCVGGLAGAPLEGSPNVPKSPNGPKADVDDAEQALAGAGVDYPMRRRMAQADPVKALAVGKHYGAKPGMTGGLAVNAYRDMEAHGFRPMEAVIDGKLAIVGWQPPETPSSHGALAGLSNWLARRGEPEPLQEQIRRSKEHIARLYGDLDDKK